MQRTSTGMAEFDELIGGGLGSQWLTLVAARPAAGKTLLACKVAATAAAQGSGVLLVTLEQDELSVCRMLAQYRETTGTAGDGVAWPIIVESGEEEDGEGGHRYVSLSLSGLRDKAAEAAAAFIRDHNVSLGLIVVDYLQLMDTEGGSVEDIPRGLKLMAMGLRVPVLATTQYPRVDEGQSLRLVPGSTDADLVAFLDSKDGERRLTVGKHRSGSKGEVAIDLSGFTSRA